MGRRDFLGKMSLGGGGNAYDKRFAFCRGFVSQFSSVNQLRPCLVFHQQGGLICLKCPASIFRSCEFICYRAKTFWTPDYYFFITSCRQKKKSQLNAFQCPHVKISSCCSFLNIFLLNAEREYIFLLYADALLDWVAGVQNTANILEVMYETPRTIFFFYSHIKANPAVWRIMMGKCEYKKICFWLTEDSHNNWKWSSFQEYIRQESEKVIGKQEQTREEDYLIIISYLPTFP